MIARYKCNWKYKGGKLKLEFNTSMNLMIGDQNPIEDWKNFDQKKV